MNRDQIASTLGYLRDLGVESFVRRRPTARPAGEGLDAPTVVASPSLPILSAEERLEQLGACSAEAQLCTACRLATTRQKVVFGSGNPNADLMFIGEGPGAEEDRQGLPFVGRAGELLTKIIEAIELRREDIYIANVVKCRPPENRDPESDEVLACRGFLERQIDLVRPRLLVVLGRIAAHTLLGNQTPISRMRGNWYSIRGTPAMVTFHPAALLRNPALKRPTWDDMRLVRDRLREPSRA